VFSLLKRYPEAIQDWDEAIARVDGKDQLLCRGHRAITLARAGSHTAAVAAVDKLAQVKGTTADTFYNGACVYALAAGAVTDDAGLREEYAARAVELLRQAIAAGYKDAPHIEKNTDFDAIRGRKEFQQLLKQLKTDNKVRNSSKESRERNTVYSSFRY
jgi:hypothetical protein